jgi:hypothetical protein
MTLAPLTSFWPAGGCFYQLPPCQKEAQPSFTSSDGEAISLRNILIGRGYVVESLVSSHRQHPTMPLERPRQYPLARWRYF